MSLTHALLLLAATAGSPHRSEGGVLPGCGVFQIGWSLVAPKDGEIREFHWETADYTELWMTLTPSQRRLGQPGVPSLLLVFSVCFRGTLKSPQDLVELRVQANRNFVGAMVPDPHLSVTAGDATYELTGPAFPHWTEYPNGCGIGDMCAYSAVLADIPVRLMRGWSDASTLTGALSATPFQITSEQQRMLREFLSRIAPDADGP